MGILDGIVEWIAEQVMQMRFSHARLSSTVRPEREKFIIKRATEAVTMAATVEMSTIWL